MHRNVCVDHFNSAAFGVISRVVPAAANLRKLTDTAVLASSDAILLNCGSTAVADVRSISNHSTPRSVVIIGTTAILGSDEPRYGAKTCLEIKVLYVEKPANTPYSDVVASAEIPVCIDPMLQPPWRNEFG